jgi:sigma-B regulation protein RsbU (phosphoserine phosphatase)
MVLGLLDDAGIPPAVRITLAPGELILLTTDGLQETHTDDGSMFGMDQALKLLRMYQHKRSRDIIEELNAAASRFRQSAPQEDDMTMVVIKAAES